MDTTFFCQHIHPNGDECLACSLNGHSETIGPCGLRPNAPGWELMYVTALLDVPERYKSAFQEALWQFNSYGDALRSAVAAV